MILSGYAHPFDLYVQRPSSQLRPAEAALLFARDRYPLLDVDACLKRLAALARRVECADATTPARQLDALREVLVDEEGLVGNLQQYYDPRNSYLNEVLDRRTGIPISLSVIWLDVCHQLEWPFVGIGLPGHFIIGHADAARRLWADPFGGGARISRLDCERLVAGTSTLGLALSEADFAPVPMKKILARMLNNLALIYVKQEAWHHAGCVLRRLLALQPESPVVREQMQAVMAKLASLN